MGCLGGAKPPNTFEGVFKRGEAPLPKLFPPPFDKGGELAGPQENRRFFWVLKGEGHLNEIKEGEVDINLLPPGCYPQL